MCLFKCITGLVSEKCLAVKVLTSPKISWNLNESIFVLPFIHSELNWVRKNYFQSDLRFWDCLITRWLETTSIIVVIEKIYHYQFKSNCVKNHRLLAIHFFASLVSTWNFKCSERKNESHTSSISEVIDSEVYAYLNA